MLRVLIRMDFILLELIHPLHGVITWDLSTRHPHQWLQCWMFPHSPVNLTCFHCQHHVKTYTKTGPSTLTWALCACMCLCLCLPCALIPFCSSRLKVTEHYCSHCDILLGKYKGW